MKKESIKNLIYNSRTLIGLLLLVVFLSILSPRFLTVANLTNVFRQTSVNMIIAIGMTFVILTGGIDLSVGSIFALSGALTAGMMVAGIPAFAAIILGMVLGGIMGACNGFLIAKGKVPAFIATLAMMTILRGATLVYTNGQPITGLGDDFYGIGNGYLLNIPIPVIVTGIVIILSYYLLFQYKIGRYIFALGGNEEASRLSGINTKGIKMLVYSISGILSALSGIIITSRLDSAQPTAGQGAELDAIAAVVLGGTSLSGGQGGVAGTVIGALIIGFLNNGLNLLNVSPFYQSIVKGIVILIAVLIDKKED